MGGGLDVFALFIRQFLLLTAGCDRVMRLHAETLFHRRSRGFPPCVVLICSMTRESLGFGLFVEEIPWVSPSSSDVNSKVEGSLRECWELV